MFLITSLSCMNDDFKKSRIINHHLDYENIDIKQVTGSKNCEFFLAVTWKNVDINLLVPGLTVLFLLGEETKTKQTRALGKVDLAGYEIKH